MIPAIHPRGDNVGGLLRYLFGPGKHEEHIDPHLVAAWLDAGELNELEPPTAGAGRRDVGWLAQLLEQPVAAARKPPAKTVWHCSIRNHTNDRTLTDAQWRHIAGEVMAAVGLAITYGRLGAARGLHGPRPPLAKWSHVYDAIRHLLATQTTANLASALAALIALAAFWAAVAANRTSRVFLVTEVRREWEDHRGDWATSLLLFRGPDDYYVDASVEERNRIRKLIANAGQDVSDNLGGFSERINMLRAETRTVRRVARFLAYCGRLVLAGRVSVADIYQILGPEVASHGRATRWICRYGIHGQPRARTR